MANSSIYLYVFSGPHLGAKITLNEGKYIIGSDESADIILYAQKESKDFVIAPRHATFSITQEELASGVITVEALDGNIYKGQVKDMQDVFTVQAGEVFYIASTCMTWNLPNVVQESIVPQLTYVNAQAIENTETNSSNEALSQENDNIVDNTFLETVQATANNDDTTLTFQDALPERKANRSFVYRMVLFVIVGLALLGMSVYFDPQTDNISTEYNYLVTSLAEDGIDNVEVLQQTINNTDSLLIEGFVQSEEERLRIQDLARTLHYPVYLSLYVQDDMLQAAQDSFALRGIHPHFELADSVLHVSAYIKDPLIEEAAYAGLRQDLGELPEIERKTVYEDDLSLRIEAKLLEKNIRSVNAMYTNGGVTIAGMFSADEVRNIHDGMNEIMDELGIPLHYNVILTDNNVQISQSVASSPNAEPVITVQETSLAQNSSESVLPVASSAPLQSFASDESVTLAGLNITSFHTGSIPFVTTQEGQRLFVGALLPNGYTIDEITNEGVTLTKGSHTITVNLNN